MEREMKPRFMGHIFISLTILVMLTGIFLGCSMSMEQRVFSHSSFTRKKCTQCHLPANFVASYDSASTKQADLPDWQVNARRLVSMPNRLCFKCHEYGSVKDGFPEGLWQHSPSAQGACVVCHNPHFSTNPFMLRSQPSAICSSQCHMEGYVLKIEAHQGPGECLDCHNAHLGINPRMLRKEYQEDWGTPKKSWIESRQAGAE
jgi:predicted CXXCH cytochrome family protein